MIEILLLLFGILSTVFVFSIIRLLSNGKRTLLITAPFVLATSYTIFIHIGILYRSLVDKTYKATIYSSLALVFIGIGIIIANVILRFRPVREIKNFLDNEVIPDVDLSFIKLISLISFLVILIATYILYMDINPLIEGVKALLRGDLEFARYTVSEGRALVGKYIEGTYRGQGILKHILRHIAPLFTMIVFMASLYYKNNKILSFVSTFLIIFSLFAVASLGERYPFIKLILCYFVGYLVFYPYKSTLKYYIKLSILMFLLLFVFSFFFMPRMMLTGHFFADSLAVLSNLTQRIFLGNSDNTYEPQFFFPPYAGFKVYEMRLKCIMPGPSNYGFDQWLGEQMGYSIGKKLVAFTSSFVGEAYVAYGMIGVCVVSFLLGFISQVINIKLIRYNKKIKSFLSLSLYPLLSLAFFGQSSIFTPLVEIIIIIFAFIYTYFLKIIINLFTGILFSKKFNYQKL